MLRAADAPATAIENRKSSKMRDHFDACKRDGIDFQPLVVETFGGWDKDAVNTLRSGIFHPDISILRVQKKKMAHPQIFAYGLKNAL